MNVVYGIALTEDHDEYAATFDVSAEGIAQGLVPGKYRIMELFPFLKGLPKWVPGFGFQADFDRWRAAVNDVKDVPFAHTKEAMVGCSPHCSFAWIGECADVRVFYCLEESRGGA